MFFPLQFKAVLVPFVGRDKITKAISNMSDKDKSSEKKKKQKSSARIWIEYVPFVMLFKCIGIIPLKVAYFISRQLFKLFFVLDKRHRIRTIQHLLHAGVAKNHDEAVKLAKECYRQFSMLLVEIVKLRNGIDDNKVGIICNDEKTRNDFCTAGKKNPQVIVITAHYGNWELAATSWAHHFGNPMVSIMRPFDNPKIGEYILSSRESDVHESIPKSGGIRGVLKALKQGKTVAILADQHASSVEGVEATFFGHPCRAHSSPALLHLKTGIPLVPMLTRRKDDKLNFEFVIGPAIQYTPTGDKEKDIQAITQLYTTGLEKLIAEEPTQWMWTHRRWLDINRKKRS